ncbi:MAG: hypothetical protein Q8P02_01435, partial [Candidatus Micrarchaeota archaeon]|nr:hypothetical protein [Candidatus Micrarchaeota archaeon]
GTDFRIPAGVAEKIRICGPENAGDIFTNPPKKAPDLVTVFNVARSYHRRHQAQLARRLAAALLDDGILLTNGTDNQTVFVGTLTEKLGAPHDLGPTHDAGKPGRVLAFRKKEIA